MVKMSILVSWAVIPSEIVSGYQCFGETDCLHLHDYFSPEDGHSMFLRNVGMYLQVRMAL